MRLKTGMFLILLSLVTMNQIKAQSFSHLDIPVTKDGQLLKSALAGGLQAAQYNAIDLDRDGVKDLLVFDRLGNTVLPFLNKATNANETNLVYSPQYRPIFEGLRNWVLVRDYNGDGIEDLFSGGIVDGIEIRRGYLDSGELKFEWLVLPGGSINVLYYEVSPGDTTQVYVSKIDVPDIVDIDKDGDLDIVAFESNGGNVHLYTNQAVENSASLESLEFRLTDACFGKFFESGFNETITLSDDPEACADQFWEGDGIATVRHAGSTICALDETGNGLYDLILGDLSNQGLVFLENTGTLTDAFMSSQDIDYPSYDVPVDLVIFNTASYIDMDNDDKRDLMVSSNNDQNGENYFTNWFYKNVGSDEEPVFEFMQDDFLVEDMIDMGFGSNPCFIDYNSDGLLDVILGSGGFYTTGGAKEARLYLFENTGTETQPAFELVDDNYLNFIEFNNTSNTYAPASGDLDGDGDIDLLIGDNQGDLYYLENTAGTGNPVSFAQPIYQYMGISLSDLSKPNIVDLNQDGLADIVVGERNLNSENGVLGCINYYQNIGTEGNPMFDSDETSSPNTSVLGEINTRDVGFATPSSAPFIFFNEAIQDFMLISGSESGKIKLYSGIVDDIYGEYERIDSCLGGAILREGKRVVPAAADIDGDGFLELALGNDRGGLSFWNTPIVVDRSLSTETPNDPLVEFKVYPNPTSDQLNITIEDGIIEMRKFEIYNSIGERVYTSQSGQNNFTIPLKNMASGVYTLKVETKQSIRSKLFVKI